MIWVGGWRCWGCQAGVRHRLPGRGECHHCQGTGSAFLPGPARPHKGNTGQGGGGGGGGVAQRRRTGPPGSCSVPMAVCRRPRSVGPTTRRAPGPSRGGGREGGGGRGEGGGGACGAADICTRGARRRTLCMALDPMPMRPRLWTPRGAATHAERRNTKQQKHFPNGRRGSVRWLPCTPQREGLWVLLGGPRWTARRRAWPRARSQRNSVALPDTRGSVSGDCFSGQWPGGVRGAMWRPSTRLRDILEATEQLVGRCSRADLCVANHVHARSGGRGVGVSR